MRNILKGYKQREDSRGKERHRNAWEPALAIINVLSGARKSDWVSYDDLTSESPEVSPEEIAEAMDRVQALNEKYAAEAMAAQESQ